MVLASIGRRDEALAFLRECDQVKQPEMMGLFLSSLRSLLQGDRESSIEATERCVVHFRDPEPLYYMSRQLVALGRIDRAIEELDHVISRGYLCGRVFDRDPWLEPLAGDRRLAGL